MGSLTSNGMIYSGFSSSNYLLFGDKVSNGILKWDSNKQYRDITKELATADSWEIGLRGKTPNTFNSEQTFLGQGRNYTTPQIDIMRTNNYAWNFIWSTTGSSWSSYIRNTSVPALTNTWYNLKIGFTGTKYYFYNKTDEDTEYTLIGEKESSTKIYNNSERFMIGADGDSSAWTGDIDISQFYVNVNGTQIWKPLETFNFQTAEINL